MTRLTFTAALLAVAMVSAACGPGSGVGADATRPMSSDSVSSADPTASDPGISADPAGSPGPGASSEPDLSESPPGSVEPTSGPSSPPTEPSGSSGLGESTPDIPEPTEIGRGTPTWVSLESSSAAPSAREDHTWTVDAAGTSAYLFGGRSGADSFEDLWRYDLATDSWTALEPHGDAPEARFGHVAVWVDDLGLVIWSGQRGSDFFSDLWAYDPSADEWRELPSSGEAPAARYGACGALAPGGQLWVSHGFTDSGRFSDTRSYDFAAGTWTEQVSDGAERPIQRCLHDCLWTPAGELLLYAGQTDGVTSLGDLWKLSVETAGSATWQKQPDPEPPARNLYALAQVGDRAYVFGGTGNDATRLNDLWTLDLGGLRWQQAVPDGEAPPARSGATLVSDPQRDRLLLFGGRTDDAALSDLWQLDLG